ncbi:MAG: DNA-binding response OmpR family regulator [Desulforhopalus sp.]|jgi:DNA-binding response OmpR family regulator
MNPKALVVDDENIIQKLLEAIVLNFGFDVTTAGDGTLAAKALRSNDFDLVITDLEMGTTNGFDVIKLAKSINSNTIVLVATGCVDERSRRKAIALGASEFFLKPFSMKDLENQLNRADFRSKETTQ